MLFVYASAHAFIKGATRVEPAPFKVSPAGTEQLTSFAVTMIETLADFDSLLPVAVTVRFPVRLLVPEVNWTVSPDVAFNAPSAPGETIQEYVTPLGMTAPDWFHARALKSCC